MQRPRREDFFFYAFKWEFRSPNRNVFPVEQNFQTKRGYTKQIPLNLATWVRDSSFCVQLDITPLQKPPHLLPDWLTSPSLVVLA